MWDCRTTSTEANKLAAESGGASAWEIGEEQRLMDFSSKMYYVSHARLDRNIPLLQSLTPSWTEVSEPILIIFYPGKRIVAVDLLSSSTTLKIN